ncbi:MAG: cation transporter [Candidatus Yanofskybacteria bacterium]|nr:cation transporter [Candidatus Yanofskybacteria bacterium]
MEYRHERLGAIQGVLWRTMALNLTVAVLKTVGGLVTGITAIWADGLHSIGDSLSNIVGLLGVRLARREPDEEYPYGYDKFESIATLVITGIIFVTLFEVIRAGIARLREPSDAIVNGTTIALLVSSMTINLFVVWYEGRAGKRLKSELLIADSNETKSDVFVTLGILSGVSTMAIFPALAWLDGVLTLLVACAIGHVIYEIVTSTARVLGDAQVVDPRRVHAIATAVPGVQFCHAIRSRGRETGFYLDLHIGVEPTITIEEAHDVVCHNVKRALYDTFPELKSAHIHIEPNNEKGRTREGSVFATRDPYGHNGNGI